MIGDLKKAKSNIPAKFENQATELDYFREAAWYSDGLFHAETLNIAVFIFITVEDFYPYTVDLFMYEENDLQFAREENAMMLRVLAECYAMDNWPK